MSYLATHYRQNKVASFFMCYVNTCTREIFIFYLMFNGEASVFIDVPCGEVNFWALAQDTATYFDSEVGVN